MRARGARLACVFPVIGAWLLLATVAETGTVCAAPPAVGAEGGTGLAAELEALFGQLGDEDYRVREAATRRVLELGDAIEPVVRARLENEADTEIRFRLRYVLENIRPPRMAALVVRCAAGSGLLPGDLITHVNNRRVRDRAELLQRLVEAAPQASTLRVRGALGPREVGPVAQSALDVVWDYRAPRGATIADAVRLYDAGYAERSYALLKTLESPVPEAECSVLFRAVLAYTAGDAASAMPLLAEHRDACQPIAPAYAWSSPSWLDMAGPGKAPFHIEWRLWTEPGEAENVAQFERDTPIQRVLVPAHRFVEALSGVAEPWWLQYRNGMGLQTDNDRVGGNMLAVSSWMLSELDLVSESLRLIEPRSLILRQSSQGVHKWIRARTDAWLAFAAGDAAEALDGFYEDAKAILRPPGPAANRLHIQNPRVAAEVAFFLYQFPNDRRVGEMLALVNQRGHPELEDYSYWMLHALRAENFDVVRTHLRALLPNARVEEVGGFGLAAALLEYVSGQPDPEVFADARARLAEVLSGSPLQASLAVVMGLEHLSAGRGAEARRVLADAGDEVGATVLRSTADFLVAQQAAELQVRTPLLAVPIGADGGDWLVLTRARRLGRFEADGGRVTPIDAPTPTWFPSPLNWPWIGREEATGRVWVYGRRRVIEVGRADEPGLALNIRTADIAAFDRYVGPVFTALAEAIAAGSGGQGEASEYWRDDLRGGQEYFANPDLPELGLIRTLPNAAQIVHVALRGGPHLLVDTAGGRAWSSDWIAGELELERAPRLLAAAALNSESPSVFLFSDMGLIRFDQVPPKLTRLELPGDAPYAAVLPESCPYARRDPRWIYCARRPQDGGAVFRVTVADNRVELLDLVNEAVPRDYYAIHSRAELRGWIDAAFAESGLPTLREVVADAEATVLKYIEENHP